MTNKNAPESSSNKIFVAVSSTTELTAVAGSNKDELRANLRQCEPHKELLPVVGLFGTCGNSTWREPVMQKLASRGIEFFNPVKPNWTAADGEIEARHANSDKVVLMVITDETEAAGSLAETGWIENAAERNGQKAIFVIQDYRAPNEEVNPKHQANRARTLVRKHAKEAGVIIYDHIELAVEDAIKAMLN